MKLKFFDKLVENHFFWAFLIFIITFAVSYLFCGWFDYPRGHDALFHLFKTRYISLFWPNHHWWYTWAGGMPLFLYYPPLPHYLMATVMLVTGIPLEFVLTIFSILSVSLTGFILYLTAFYLTKKRPLSFIAALVYLTCPSSWAMIFNSGVYMRALSMPLFALCLYSFIRLSYELEKDKKNSNKLKFFALTGLSLGLLILSHQFIAGITFATLIFFALFFVKRNLLFKLFLLIKVCIIALLLSASFWLPLLIFFPSNPTTSWVSKAAQKLIVWQRLIPLPTTGPNWQILTHNYHSLFRLPLYLLPLIAILGLIVLLFRQKKTKKQSFKSRIAQFFAWMILLWLVYGTGNLLKLETIFPLIRNAYAFLGTLGALYFIPIYGSLIISLLLFWLLPNRQLYYFITLGIFLFLISIYMVNEHQAISVALKNDHQATKVQKRDFSFVSKELTSYLNNQEYNNYRLGFAETTKDALYLSNQVPNLSQTGHYFSPGVANFNLYYYMEKGLWQSRVDEQENEFLLDWWAIKPILTVSNDKISSKLSNQLLELSKNDQSANLYEYKNASPILSPTQAPTVLVIGSPQAYEDTFFRSLALGNVNSQQLIPIRGEASIQSYLWHNLSDFDVVFLYDYHGENLEWETAFLSEFVRNGGQLIIESNQEVELQQNLPDPWPIKRINSSQRLGNWEFKIENSNPYLNKEELVFFSPASYKDDAWGISEGIDTKDWAKVILSSKGKPVLVEGNYGKGKVLWSGLNLPFHIFKNKNKKELQLWVNMIRQLSFNPEEMSEFETKRINPQKRVITLKEPAKGVIFKENYFPNWHAKAKTDSKTYKLKIHPTGPGFMYVSLPEGVKEVVFYYQRSLIEIIADLISLLTFGWLVLSLVKFRKIHLLKR